jgi:hypothetical protein
MAKRERATMMEQYGVAVNSSNLRIGRLPGEQDIERPLDKVAAMGMASLALRLGDQSLHHAAVPVPVAVRVGLARSHVPMRVAAPVPLGIPDRPSLTIAAAALRPSPRPEHLLVAELVPVLWRMKAGGQIHADNENQAVRLFARWMAMNPRFRTYCDTPAHYPRLLPYAQASIREWLHDRCGKCGGSGKLQLTDRGPVRARGGSARNTRFVACKVCHGTGHAIGNDTARGQAMGLNPTIYDAAGWPGHFRVAKIWLDQIARRANRHLRREQERG